MALWWQTWTGGPWFQNLTFSPSLLTKFVKIRVANNLTKRYGIYRTTHIQTIKERQQNFDTPTTGTIITIRCKLEDANTLILSEERIPTEDDAIGLRLACEEQSNSILILSLLWGFACLHLHLMHLCMYWVPLAPLGLSLVRAPGLG